jgi:hypothetical protein
MNTPHRHAQFIKAWADGRAIQTRFGGRWTDVSGAPTWGAEEYRFKPEPPPDVVMYYCKEFMDSNMKQYGRTRRAMA